MFSNIILTHTLFIYFKEVFLFLRLLSRDLFMLLLNREVETQSAKTVIQSGFLTYQIDPGVPGFSAAVVKAVFCLGRQKTRLSDTKDWDPTPAYWKQ